MKITYCSRFKKKAPNAFTLIELLVAIAILAILAGLLFPALGKMRAHSRQVGCMSNLKNYGTALFAVLHDFNGSFPNWYTDQNNVNHKPTFNSWVVGKGYLPEILRCPLGNADDLKKGGFYYTGVTALCRWEYFAKPLTIPYPHSRIVFATEMYHYGDGLNSATHLNMTVWGNTGTPTIETEGRNRTPQYHGTRDRRSLNMMFMDGHIELVNPGPSGDWRVDYPSGANATNDGGPVYLPAHIKEISQLGRIK
jgi:prepilin-type N-terminal cleavage/methylation domain-containing protein